MFDIEKHVDDSYREFKKQGEISVMEASMHEGADPTDWAIATALRAVGLSVHIGLQMGLPMEMFPELMMKIADKLDGGKQVK